MLCYDILCYNTILYYTILYYTILYYTILYYVILCYAMLCYAMLSHACWVTGFSGKPPYREMRGLAGWEKQAQELQSSSLHPWSHWSQCTAFPDMRISLMIWSSEPVHGHYVKIAIVETNTPSVQALALQCSIRNSYPVPRAQVLSRLLITTLTPAA